MIFQGLLQPLTFSDSVILCLPSSVCRAVKWFCKDSSQFEEGLFLLMVVGSCNFHSTALLPPLLSVCAGGEVFGCMATVSLQTPPGSKNYLLFCLPDAIHPSRHVQ